MPTQCEWCISHPDPRPTRQADARHGRGKCVYGVGLEYDGEWKNDVHCGFGKWTTHDEKYEGAFVDNMRHGQVRNAKCESCESDQLGFGTARQKLALATRHNSHTFAAFV